MSNPERLLELVKIPRLAVLYYFYNFTGLHLNASGKYWKLALCYVCSDLTAYCFLFNKAARKHPLHNH